MPDMDTPSHTPGTPRGEDHAEPAKETKGASERPAGEQEDSPMDPENA